MLDYGATSQSPSHLAPGGCLRTCEKQCWEGHVYCPGRFSLPNFSSKERKQKASPSSGHQHSRPLRKRKGTGMSGTRCAGEAGKESGAGGEHSEGGAGARKGRQEGQGGKRPEAMPHAHPCMRTPAAPWAGQCCGSPADSDKQTHPQTYQGPTRSSLSPSTLPTGDPARTTLQGTLSTCRAHNLRPGWGQGSFTSTCWLQTRRDAIFVSKQLPRAPVPSWEASSLGTGQV